MAISRLPDPSGSPPLTDADLQDYKRYYGEMYHALLLANDAIGRALALCQPEATFIPNYPMLEAMIARASKGVDGARQACACAVVVCDDLLSPEALEGSDDPFIPHADASNGRGGDA